MGREGGYTILSRGPVAQGQGVRLITGWFQVRILAGPPKADRTLLLARTSRSIALQVKGATHENSDRFSGSHQGFSSGPDRRGSATTNSSQLRRRRETLRHWRWIPKPSLNYVHRHPDMAWLNSRESCAEDRPRGAACPASVLSFPGSGAGDSPRPNP